MVRRKPADNPSRRVAGSGTRRTVATKSKGSVLSLDDSPLDITPMRDPKRLVVHLPHELWIVELRAGELHFGQNIELPTARPSVAEGASGQLWIGGDHLHRGSAFATEITKVGTKLGGYVDHVAVLRPGLLAAVGAQGEVLIDLEKDAVLHKRRAKNARGLSVAASADERAIFADGSSAAWIIDPAHPGGYTKLRFERRSDHELAGEGIVRVHVDAKGRCLLAARDGAVAWTKASLRRGGEQYAALPASERACLGLDADPNWVYVLRPRGRLQRFLIEAPTPAEPTPQAQARGHRRAATPAEPQLPSVQEFRLARVASCLACVTTPEGPRLVFGGPHSDGLLGRLWLEDPAALAWSEVQTTPRPIQGEPASHGRSAPNFEQIRNKLPADSASLASISVDEVIGGRVPFWVVQGTSQWPERNAARLAPEALLPADTLLLPAMIRTKDGGARPGLLAWPGVPEDRDSPTPEPTWLCWGDDPRGWMAMDTPSIRAQRWSRSELFPMQVSLRGIPDAPGRRARLPKRWPDREQFDAMARECKKLLKVLW